MREPNSRSLFSRDGSAGSCLRVVLCRFFVTHHHMESVAGYAAREARAITVSFFLLPRENRRGKAHRVRSCGFRYFVAGLFRIRNAKLFAANQNLDSTRRMIPAINGGSKLCACATRHASENFLTEISAAQLGKGRCFAPPRCIPSCVPQAAPVFAEVKTLRLCLDTPETVPVSTPFDLHRVVRFRSSEIRP